jgi:hypothetical protein
MKKIIFIFTLLVFTYGVQAQTPAPLLKTTFTSGAGKTMDSTTAVLDTVVFVFPASNMKNGSITCQGSVINGSPIVTGLLQVSADGVYWSTRQPAQQINGDTINLSPATNAVAEKSLAIPANQWTHLRVLLLNHTAADMRLRCYVTSRRD